MAFNADGSFTRSNGDTGWVDDANANVMIRADLHDAHDLDLAKGLGECLTRTNKGGPTANLDWRGYKITNLGVGTLPGDAVNLNQLSTYPGWATSKYISGADLDGRLNFTGPSGVNGITWTYTTSSLVTRIAKAGETNTRLVFNNSHVPPTTTNVGDVFIVDDSGRINNVGILTQNTSYDASQARAIAPGIGTVLTYNSGVFAVSSNDVATITNNYAAITPRTFFQVQNSIGTTTLTLQKNGPDKVNRIQAMNGSEHRWIMDLGNSTTESATRKGSNFALYSYDNTGANAVSEMFIDRETHKVTFYGEVSTPNLTTTDAVMTVGPATAGSDFAMQRPAPMTSGSFSIYGGQAASSGAYIQLFGETHASNARDIVLGAENGYRYFYDYSLAKHFWANNTPAAVMDLTSAGTLTISGRLLANTFVGSTGTNLILSTPAAGLIYFRTNGADSSTNQSYIDSAGNLVISGQMNLDSILTSTDTTMILASALNGQIIFRPNGPTSDVDQVHIDISGNLILSNAIPLATGGVYAGKGLRGKIGDNGAYGSFFQNFNWSGTTLTFYAGSSPIGTIGVTCDHRIKKNISPLGSMWDKVKALNPISYSQRAYEVWSDDDTEQWGFLAHELQDSLAPSAASGVKDGPDVQSLNLLTLLAAMAKALQEAMARIETLEAA